MVSGAVAAGLVCWAMWCLMSIQSPEEQGLDATDVPMRVVWIERDQRISVDEEALPEPERNDTAPAVRSRSLLTQRPQREAREVTPHAAEPEGPRQIDLSLRAAPIEFRPAEIGTRASREEPPPLMRVQFHDRSFGGTLQRMTQSVICAELRHEASRAPASAEQIAASMARHGCAR